MILPGRIRGLVLAGAILFCGGAQAAYPTPGADALDFQVHAVPMADPQAVLDAYLAENEIGGYSLAADRRSQSIVAVAPPAVQRALARYILKRTADRMKRFVVEMKVAEVAGSERRVLATPRLEVPAGEGGLIHLGGEHHGARVHWQSQLEVSPKLDDRGRIMVRLRGGKEAGDEAANDVEVFVRPGVPVLVDPVRTEDPALRAFAERLGAGSPAGYSVTFSVRPL